MICVMMFHSKMRVLVAKNITRPIFHDRAKTARNVTAPTISRKSSRVRGQQMQEMMSHGLCHDISLQNAGPACQEYQTTLAQSSMIGRKT